MDNSYEDMSSADYPSWSVKALFSIPLGNKKAKSEFNSEKIKNLQILTELKKTEKKMITDIKSKIRSLHTTIEKIEAAKKSLELAKENYNIEVKRFELNKSTTYDVLEFQNNLAQAETNYLKAVIENRVSYLEYLISAGSLLNEKKIIIKR